MTPITHRSMRAVAALAIALAAPQALAADGGWDWMVAPYVWAPSISTDLSTDAPPSESSNDSEFDDIVDKIEGGFLLHAEGQGDDFGVFGDVVYLGLGDEKETPNFDTESDLDARLFDVAAVWSPGAERMQGFEAFAGLRWIDVDLTLRLDPANPLFDDVTVDGGESFSDFLVGARYTWPLAERWALTLRGDGSFGESDGTWSVAGNVQYKTRNGAWIAGYRHLDVELEAGDSSTHLVLSGPMIGYGFRF